MAPRTVLGIIDGNRGVRSELTPNQRRKIEGAKLANTTFRVISEIGKCILSTAKTTVRRASKCHNRYSLPRSGRPREWDSRFERRVLQLIHINLKTTYQ